VGPRPTEVTLLPWLLRRTTRLFVVQVSGALSSGGFGDLSRPGMWAIQALHDDAQSASDLVDALQVTKQAVSALVDELVVSGYVRRASDPHDRRRTMLLLTTRGIRAAGVIEKACDQVEKELEDSVGAADMVRLRRTLVQLVANARRAAIR